MPYKCYSHPGKYLVDHLNNVKKIGLEVFDSKKLLKLPVSREDYRKALEMALYYHDLGKSTKYFQNYLQYSSKNQEYLYEKKLTRHSLLSAVIATYKAFEQFKDKRLPCLVFSCILKHHGDLVNFSNMLIIKESDWDILKKQWDNIVLDDFDISLPEFSKAKTVIDNELYDARDENWSIDWYYANNLMFSILTYADKNDVIFEKSINFKATIDTDVVYIYKKKSFTIGDDINKLREKSYSITENAFLSHFNNYIFSLNLPTGFGKTLSAINLALKTIEKDNTIQRAIYALPFTSIVDQTADTIRRLFAEKTDNMLNVHHHLAKLEIKISEEYIDTDKAQFIIENWDKPFIVTTFWQIFYSLLSNENSVLRKFHNIANSVIILDEIQVLPYKYWGLVNHIFKKLTQVLNCKVIFMTATMPAIFKSDEIVHLIDPDNRRRFFKAFDRYSIEKINNLEEIRLNEFLEMAIKNTLDNPDKDFMFIFNTIKSATKFFCEFKKISNIESNLFFLSSRVAPIDRIRVIDRIKQVSERKILVTTQLVEAGVDIDFDIVYRDFAPLDNIIQAAGRCNRNKKKSKGKVYVFRLKNESNKFDCDYIYKGLTLDRTFIILKNSEIFDESNLIDIIDQYYNEIKNNSSTNESNALIKNVENLEYEDIKKRFNLVDEIPSYNVFVEKDENASEILAELKEIYKINDIFERKRRFLDIKNQFYQYVISLPRLSADAGYFRESFDEIGPFKIVIKDNVQMLYKEDIGFSSELDDNFL